MSSQTPFKVTAGWGLVRRFETLRAARQFIEDEELYGGMFPPEIEVKAVDGYWYRIKDD